MANYTIDLSNFIETVVRDDDNSIIEQLRDLINEKYITTQPVSIPPREYKSEKYPLPFWGHIDDAVRREFRRVYNDAQIAIIIQNVLELYHLLWNQNVTGFAIYTIIVIILQDEPTETLRRLIPKNLINAYDLNYDGTNMVSRRMMICHEEYIELTMQLLHSERVLNNHLMLRLENGPATLDTRWYHDTYTNPCISYHRPLEWDMLSRGWPLDLIEECVSDHIKF